MEFSNTKLKRPSGLDNTFNIMKESKLIEMQKKIESLSRIAQQLITDMRQIDVLARGTLTAFQLNIGEEEWEKVVKQLQEREAKNEEPKEKKLELDVE